MKAKGEFGSMLGTGVDVAGKELAAMVTGEEAGEEEEEEEGEEESVPAKPRAVDKLPPDRRSYKKSMTMRFKIMGSHPSAGGGPCGLCASAAAAPRGLSPGGGGGGGGGGRVPSGAPPSRSAGDSPEEEDDMMQLSTRAQWWK